MDLMPSACYKMSSYLIWNLIALNGPVEVMKAILHIYFHIWKRTGRGECLCDVTDSGTCGNDLEACLSAAS